jgi:hypothetical protein
MRPCFVAPSRPPDLTDKMHLLERIRPASVEKRPAAGWVQQSKRHPFIAPCYRQSVVKVTPYVCPIGVPINTLSASLLNPIDGVLMVHRRVRDCRSSCFQSFYYTSIYERLFAYLHTIVTFSGTVQPADGKVARKQRLHLELLVFMVILVHLSDWRLVFLPFGASPLFFSCRRSG